MYSKIYKAKTITDDAPLIVDEQAWVAVDHPVMASVCLFVGWYNLLASWSYIVLLQQQQQHRFGVAICSWLAYHVPGGQPCLSSVPAKVRTYH
jgi:hypothetical protein